MFMGNGRRTVAGAREEYSLKTHTFADISLDTCRRLCSDLNSEMRYEVCSKSMHENEENWSGKGRASLPPPPSINGM